LPQICDFIDEGDVDVTLRVLDRLCRFRGLDRRGTEHAAAGDCAVDAGKLFKDFIVLAGNHLGDFVDAMVAVAGVNPLGAVSEPEIAAPLKPGRALDLRRANLLGHAGIDGALVDDGRSPLGIDQSGDGARGGNDGAKVGAVASVNRRRHGHNVDIGAGTILRLGGQLQGCGLKLSFIDFSGSVLTSAKLVDALRIHVEAGRAELAGKRNGQRQPDIAETDDDDAAPRLHERTYNHLVRFGYGSSKTDAIIRQR